MIYVSILSRAGAHFTGNSSLPKGELRKPFGNGKHANVRVQSGRIPTWTWKFS